MTALPPLAPPATRVRDLLLVEEAGARFVMACDSVGGIGPKPADTFQIDAASTGHFATRVPLLEIICAGAQPLVVVNNLCVEAEPTGREMIQAVRDLAATVGVPAENVTGSTEDNVETRSTGIGVTVLGVLPGPGSAPDGAGRARPGGGQAGDVVACLGLPRSAPADRLYIGHPDLVDLGELSAALASGLIHDALPVGSKGLAWEAPLLAQTAGLDLVWDEARPVPIERTGGPSSCVLIACAPDDLPAVRSHFAATLPIHVVGTLREQPVEQAP